MNSGTVADAATGGPGRELAHDGKLGELYGIFLVNFLLNIVTLGFYRFWARARMRRYIWAHVSLHGDAFEYTGTGGELFKGFLIVVGLFFVATILKSVVELQSAPDSPAPVIANLVFGLAIVYLIFVARYAAQRYRLTRTTWRGIRGGMTGSAWAWGLKALLFTLLSGITLGFAGPWTQMRLVDDRLNNSYFGDAKATIQSSSKPLYLAFFIGVGIMIAGVIAIMIATGAVAVISGLAAQVKDIVAQSSGQAETQVRMQELFKQHMWLLIGFGAGFYLCLVILGMVAFAQYYVAMAREIARKLTLAELGFGTTITIGRLINRVFWNAVIILFTLGFGLPIAIHRSLRFLADNIRIYGQIEGSEITQSNLPRPRYGEGLLEAFDPGFI